MLINNFQNHVVNFFNSISKSPNRKFKFNINILRFKYLINKCFFSIKKYLNFSYPASFYRSAYLKSKNSQ